METAGPGRNWAQGHQRPCCGVIITVDKCCFSPAPLTLTVQYARAVKSSHHTVQHHFPGTVPVQVDTLFPCTGGQ